MRRQAPGRRKQRRWENGESAALACFRPSSPLEALGARMRGRFVLHRAASGRQVRHRCRLMDFEELVQGSIISSNLNTRGV